MVPVPDVTDLETFNEELARQCREDLARQLRGQPMTKAERLQEEGGELLPLPKQSFTARRVELAKSSSLSLVRFDSGDYSVPTAYANRPVAAVGSINEVRLIVNDHLVARHARDWGRQNVHYDPRHYLALLERKPGALDFARPLEEWEPPACFGLLRRRLETDAGPEGRREFIRVLRLLESCTLGELTLAVERALARLACL